MSVQRVNLHFHDYLHPKLYAATESLHGKAKAELIRYCAEMYLTIQENAKIGADIPSEKHSLQTGIPSRNRKDSISSPGFGDDLKVLLTNDQSVSFQKDDTDEGNKQ